MYSPPAPIIGDSEGADHPIKSEAQTSPRAGAFNPRPRQMIGGDEDVIRPGCDPRSHAKTPGLRFVFDAPHFPNFKRADWLDSDACDIEATPEKDCVGHPLGDA